VFSSPSSVADLINEFRISEHLMRYSLFAPKLYNYCKSLGYERGKVMPSRAFCSDESQGYPIIMLTKHFGTFPFNHGRVGGIVATGRHGPYASHGKDLVIVQASHVGYDASTRHFGTYRRLHTENLDSSSNCGKIESVLSWYLAEYDFARRNIYLEHLDGVPAVTIDNQLLQDFRSEGLFVVMDRIAASDSIGAYRPIRARVTGKSFAASRELRETLGDSAWPAQGTVEIGDGLLPEMFRFKRRTDVAPVSDTDVEGRNQLETNLIKPMSWIVTSPEPLLTAAKINTQVEFDRVFRTIVRTPAYRGKKILLVSGLNIDISPQPGQLFPLTKFVPWAAYYQDGDGSHFTLEQQVLFDALSAQNDENPDQIDLEEAIRSMGEAQEVEIAAPSEHRCC
jgi:hypothetical protein